MYTITMPYPYNALEPNINELSVKNHYLNHHLKYLNNLNNLIDSTYKLEDIPKNIDKFPLEKRGDILYNVGGVLNHNLYFLSLNKVKSNPNGELLKQIIKEYQSLDNFKEAFISKANKLVGSGYTFLATDKNNNLIIMNLPNQETPLNYDLIPLFTIDLWEHAYYLQYQSNRKSYINNFFEKANFDYASYKYNEFLHK